METRAAAIRSNVRRANQPPLWRRALSAGIAVSSATSDKALKSVRWLSSLRDSKSGAAICLRIVSAARAFFSRVST